MRILKLVLISAVVLFALLTALSLLLPSHVRISRAIDINAPREKIVQYIGDLQQWKTWNQFVKQADSMNMLVESSPTTLRAGELEIQLLSKTNDTIHTTWRRDKGKTFSSHFAFIGPEVPTTVQWYFDFHLDWYPWQKLQSIIFDKELGPVMETSLVNLKQLVETSQ